MSKSIRSIKSLKTILGILSLFAISIASSCSVTKSVPDNTINENLIIYYSPDCGNTDLLTAAKKYGSKILYVYKNINGIAVTVPKSKTVTDAMKYYEGINGVLSVTRDQKMQLD